MARRPEIARNLRAAARGGRLFGACLLLAACGGGLSEETRGQAETAARAWLLEESQWIELSASAPAFIVSPAARTCLTGSNLVTLRENATAAKQVRRLGQTLAAETGTLLQENAAAQAPQLHELSKQLSAAAQALAQHSDHQLSVYRAVESLAQDPMAAAQRARSLRLNVAAAERRFVARSEATRKLDPTWWATALAKPRASQEEALDTAFEAAEEVLRETRRANSGRPMDCPAIQAALTRLQTAAAQATAASREIAAALAQAPPHISEAVGSSRDLSL